MILSTERLKALRKSKGLSQRQVAAALNIGRTTYLKYESGDSNPHLNKLQELAKFFDVPVGYLLLDDNSSTINVNTENKITNSFYLIDAKEIELVKNYRKLNAANKKEIDNLIDYKLYLQNKYKNNNAKATQNKAV